MNHQLQQLFGLGLEIEGFFMCFYGHLLTSPAYLFVLTGIPRISLRGGIKFWFC